MNSSRCRAALGILLAFVAACGGSTPSQPSPTPSPTPVLASLSGAVVDSDTRQPAPGARVEGVQGVNQGAVSTADAEGRYRLDNLQLGTFTVRAQATGFETASQSVTLTGSRTLDFTLRAAPPAGPGVHGVVIDGLSDRGLPGVLIRIDGLGEATTGLDGSFAFPTADPEQARPVTMTSSGTVERATRLRVPGPDATLSLIPTSVDMTAFNQMFRGAGDLHRWTDPPRLVVERRLLQFTTVSAPGYRALGPVMSDQDVAGLIADLEWALSQLTGGRFQGFADQQVEVAAEGADVPVGRTGAIVVARYEGLTAGSTFWGYTRWNWNGLGELLTGFIMLDSGFDTSGSPFRRSLRAHEFGHALGYRHVTVRDSVMQSHARTEPTPFDRDGARIAFQRPPGNRAPDMDPDPFVGNLRGLAAQVFWAGSH